MSRGWAPDRGQVDHRPPAPWSTCWSTPAQIAKGEALRERTSCSATRKLNRLVTGPAPGRSTSVHRSTSGPTPSAWARSTSCEFSSQLRGHLLDALARFPPTTPPCWPVTGVHRGARRPGVRRLAGRPGGGVRGRAPAVPGPKALAGEEDHHASSNRDTGAVVDLVASTRTCAHHEVLAGDARPPRSVDSLKGPLPRLIQRGMGTGGVVDDVQPGLPAPAGAALSYKLRPS
ncbi:hypothetical protein QJS66_02585 [Kocuria rhizophila]|nr:hypothetical protein QJS66_02585 [Kocuria rhizophila]